MGKLAISMAMFNSELLNYQRVSMRYSSLLVDYAEVLSQKMAEFSTHAQSAEIYELIARLIGNIVEILICCWTTYTTWSLCGVDIWHKCSSSGQNHISQQRSHVNNVSLADFMSSWSMRGSRQTLTFETRKRTPLLNDQHQRIVPLMIFVYHWYTRTLT